jgi:hypothetical protein
MTLAGARQWEVFVISCISMSVQANGGVAWTEQVDSLGDGCSIYAGSNFRQ